MKICVIGTGYVGLVTGVVFSDLGSDVICVDKIREKIDKLNNHLMPFYEPGLEGMVKSNVREERLSFTTDIGHAVKTSDIIFIAVGTPSANDGTGKTDLSYVKEAAEDIAKHLNRYKIIVNKSTVPVETGDLVTEIMESRGWEREKDFDVASNPEFLREGSAIDDATKPHRIVIGVPNGKVAGVLKELYAPLKGAIITTDVRSSEIIKYASNAFLAMKISFINTIANLCEKAKADVAAVSKGMGADKRIGEEFLQAGFGYGGSCFPKDVVSLIYTTEDYNENFDLLRHVVKINDDRIPRFISRLEEALGEEGFSGKTIGLLGLAFKPDTDDMREAKSMEIICRILEKGGQIRAFDPQATENAQRELPLYAKHWESKHQTKIDTSRITYCSNPYEPAIGADALVVVTEWREFTQLDMERIKNSMKTPILFDGRNIYNPEKQKEAGFDYYSIGR